MGRRSRLYWMLSLIFAAFLSCQKQKVPFFSRETTILLMDRLEDAVVESPHPEGVTRKIRGIRGTSVTAPVGTRISFPHIPVYPNACLFFGYGLFPPGKEASFRVFIKDERGEERVFERTLVLQRQGGESSWQDGRVRLEKWAGKTITISLVTRGEEKDPKKNLPLWRYPHIASSGRKEGEESTCIVRAFPLRNLIDDFQWAEVLEENPAMPVRPEAMVKDHLNLQEKKIPLSLRAVPPSRIRFRVPSASDTGFEFEWAVRKLSKRGLEGRVEVRILLGEEVAYKKQIPLGGLWATTFDGGVLPFPKGEKEMVLTLETVPVGVEKVPSGFQFGWKKATLVRVEKRKRALSSLEAPNLILITADTVRTDHLGCYGYSRETSPNLDRMAREGIVFQNMLSQSSWTLPSTATLLTGLYPYSHGVVTHSRRYLLDSLPFLPKALQQKGVTSAAFIANPLIDKDNNFHQGFDEFYDFSWAPAEIINRSLCWWIRENREQRFFAYVHFLDPHFPYFPPEKYRNFFGGPPSDEIDLKQMTIVDQWKKDLEKEGKAQIPQEVMDRLIALYDGEIRYIDDELGKLVEELEALGILDHTIIVYTSDHGEEFLEHNFLHHGNNLFQETLQVPLVVGGGGGILKRIGGGKKISARIEVVDIFPTVCSWMNCEVPSGCEGASLVPLFHGGEAKENAFSMLDGRMFGGGPPRTQAAVLMKEWKLISYPLKNRKELYNISRDPGEKKDLIQEHPEVGRELSRILEAWLKRTRERMPDTRMALGKKALENLRALGYMESDKEGEVPVEDQNGSSAGGDR